nr:phage tail tape measure protein [Shinella pollutisoli]
MVDAVAAGYALQRALAAPIRAASEFESAMADVRKVVDFDTPQAFKDFQTSVLQMSKRLPLAAQDLTKIVAAAGQAGIAREELLRFTDMAAKVGVAFDITAEQTGEALAKVMTGLDLSVDQVGRLADAMNHLSNAQASSAADILDVVRRVGATSKQYGYSAVEVSAFASAMLSAGMESEVVATSFRNMGLALTRGASATKRQRQAFRALGLDATKVSKAMQRDAVGTTLEVLEAIGKLPKDLQASLSSDLFGNEARALGPLLTNLNLLKKSLGLVANETDYAGSATREYEARAATFANNLQLFRNRLNAVAVTIGNVLLPPLTAMMDKLGPIVDAVQRFAEAHPTLTANVIAATSALIGFRIALAGLRFAGLFVKGGALSLLAATFGRIAAAGSKMGGAVRATWALQAALAGGASYGGLAKAADALKAIARITPGLRLVGPAIGAIVAALGSLTVPIVAGIAAVAAVGFTIWKYWDRLSSIFRGVALAIGDQLAPAFEAARPVLEWLAPVGDAIAWAWEKAASALSAVGDWFGSIFSRELLSEDQKAALEGDARDITNRIINGLKVGHGLLLDAGVQMIQSLLGGMASKIGEAVTWAATIPQRIRAAFGKIDFKDAVSIEALVAAFKSANAQIFAAGADMIQSLWDGMVSKVEQLIAWVKTIPARIKAAITTDLSGAIRGLIPSWAGGGGGGGGDSQPAVDGKRASGGPVYPGRSYLVGEQGPEIITPSRSGYVHPNGSGGGGSFNQTVNINITGAQDDEAIIDKVKRAISDATREALRGVQADYGFKYT